MATKCCGFSALRCWLVILNVFYIAISLFLIGLVIAARTLAYHLTSITVVVGIAVAAALLFAVAVIGLIGSLRHNQVVLFFYMVILGLTGVLLFSVSVAALAVPKSFRDTVFQTAWESLSYERKGHLQDSLNCCGFDEIASRYFDRFGNKSNCTSGHPLCNSTILLKKCCKDPNELPPLFNGSDPSCEIDSRPKNESQCPHCNPCYTSWEKVASSGVSAAGAFGLIFSFTQVIGIVLTFYYRNQKDPRANPSAFL